MNREAQISQIGPYRLLSLIAEGGMAGVYLAEKEEAAGLKRTVAIKRIRPELASAPHFIERFISEARISLDLQHPNLIRIYGFEKIGDELLLVMEYIDGCDSGALKNRIIPAAAFRSLAAQAADALAALHAIGITHRDISPSNILIDRSGLVKLGDFGISAAMDSHATPQDFGKRRYMSPAALGGLAATPQDDMFSLALTLAECAAGGGIDNAAGQPDLKSLSAAMRKLGMEREAALLLRAAGFSENPIEAHEFAAAMRAIGPEDKQALAGLVNSSGIKKDTADLTLSLPAENKAGSKARSDGTPRRFLKWVLLLAAIGFIVAQILTAIILRDNGEKSEASETLPLDLKPQQQPDTDYAMLPLDAKPRAAVRIDGEEKGDTPLRLKLSPGEYTIEFIWPAADQHETSTTRRAYLHSGPNREIFVSRPKNQKR